MNLETPQISNQCYTSNTVEVGEVGMQGFVGAVADLKYRPPKQRSAQDLLNDYRNVAPDPNFNKMAGNLGGLQVTEVGVASALAEALGEVKKQKKEKEVAARIVRVFIADTDENLAVEKRLLHTGEEKLTDATDQELFFEVEIKSALEKHNAIRVETLDKKATAKAGKDVFLEPIKIRDLKMVVINVATF